MQALVPDVIRVKQWPLQQDRRVQRHSCITGAGVRPVAVTAGRGGWNEGAQSAAEAQLDSKGVVWKADTLQGRLLDYLQQGVVTALLCLLVNSLYVLAGRQNETKMNKQSFHFN